VQNFDSNFHLMQPDLKVHLNSGSKLNSPLLLWVIRATSVILMLGATFNWKVDSPGPFTIVVFLGFGLALYPVHYLVARRKFGIAVLCLMAVGMSALLGSLNLTGAQIGFVNFSFLMYSIFSITMFMPEFSKRARVIPQDLQS
jgi:hypothetical protein